MAWVQETVGAKMSRRARVSCCKWGSEKIAELTHRFVGASNGFKHRYVGNRRIRNPRWGGSAIVPAALTHTRVCPSAIYTEQHLQNHNFWHGDDDVPLNCLLC